MISAEDIENVEVVEVGARDGLQNEKVIFDTESKLALINRALGAGVKRLEVASFVHPKRVPQMADAEAVIAGLRDRKDVTYIGLVLNKRGVLRAFETRSGGARGVDEVGAVAIATDGFAQANQGQTSDESVSVASEIVRLAKAEGMTGQITLSAAFGCPFEGRVSADRVVEMAKRLAECEPREIALADTIGVGVPHQVSALVSRVREAVPHIPLRAHFHNTRNTGIANAWAAYQAGVQTLDASMGGLGGCPFAPKATGNIATEDLVYMLEESGVGTGLDLNRLITAGDWLTEHLGRPVPAMVTHAGGFPQPREGT